MTGDAPPTDEDGFEQPFSTPLSARCWCQKCERVYRTASWFRNDWYCPHCEAPWWELADWEEIRAENPHYPARPDDGVLFPRRGW